MKFARVTATGAFIVTTMVPGAAFATSGYGPSGPTGVVGSPGGYTQVSAVRTVGSSGGTISTDVAGGSLEVTVPAGTFDQDVQVKVTSPTLARIHPSALGLSGTVVAGFGLKLFDTSGEPITGTFSPAVVVTLTGRALGSQPKVYRFTTRSAVARVRAARGPDGTLTIRLTQDPDVFVLAGTDASTGSGATTSTTPGETTIPGATSQKTGLPLTGERLGAIGLALVAGGLGVGAARRRRASVRSR